MNPIIENPLTWMYLPTALGLGALHALEPGHAKTLTAAYLIGIKGTRKDAIFLGLSVATTHSIVVIGISIAALWLGREAFAGEASHYLQLASGGVVVILGLWMLFRRLRHMRATHVHGHHHAPEPFRFTNKICTGVLEIINTPSGERMRIKTEDAALDLQLRVIINRPDGFGVLNLVGSKCGTVFTSEVAPNEPHEFSAELEISSGSMREVLPFEIHEPHENDHSHMSDDEHAKAHAATLPDYAKRGERPTLPQILAFGAAGGMIPCPASITVMLLALSIGQTASGILAVLGFSMGLAITLVGVGMIVVTGISRLQNGSGRLHWLSAKAPIISAGVVVLSGIAALVLAH
jgi:nickel/cobalt exporter